MGGMSRVDRCTTVGRALMKMDLTELVLKLDEIKRIPPPVYNQMYVQNYLNAYLYSNEEDMLAWIRANKKKYALRHMIGLIYASGVGTGIVSSNVNNSNEGVSTGMNNTGTGHNNQGDNS